jgi:hypothetical protein
MASASFSASVFPWEGSVPNDASAWASVTAAGSEEVLSFDGTGCVAQEEKLKQTRNKAMTAQKIFIEFTSLVTTAILYFFTLMETSFFSATRPGETNPLTTKRNDLAYSRCQ